MCNFFTTVMSGTGKTLDLNYLFISAFFYLQKHYCKASKSRNDLIISQATNKTQAHSNFHHSFINI